MAQKIQSSKKEIGKNDASLEEEIAPHKKTTVSLPPVVIDRLQLYIAKNPKANLRDQSNIIIYSLIMFINKNLEEKYWLKPSDFLDPQKTLERLRLPDKIE